MKQCVIMRGLPGSGKSTKARVLLEASTDGGVVLSSDDYFVDSDGVYRFASRDLSAAHAWNQEHARAHMRNGVPLVIIDNTCVQAWEARAYCEAAAEHGYTVSFVEAGTPWAFDAHTLAHKNTHGVPLATIQNMLARWEPVLTVDACLVAKAPWER